MISNTQDLIDSRSIIERIDELEEERCEADLDEGDELELAVLRELAEQAEDITDEWTDGVVLIRDDYFMEYARKLADDLDLIPRDYTWPISCIDWAQAARELKMDYGSVDFNGVTYWVRA